MFYTLDYKNIDAKLIVYVESSSSLFMEHLSFRGVYTSLEEMKVSMDWFWL